MSKHELSRVEREALEVLHIAEQNGQGLESSRAKRANEIISFLQRAKEALLNIAEFEQEAIDRFFKPHPTAMRFDVDNTSYELFYYAKSENEEHLRLTVDQKERIDLHVGRGKNGEIVADLKYFDDVPDFSNNIYNYEFTKTQTEKIVSQLEYFSA